VNAAAVIDLRSGHRSRLAARLRNEDGIGLVELLIALLVLNVGIFATLGAFTSAATTIRRASHISTAAALADKQMEAYRDSSYASIPPACNPTPTTSTTTSSATGADGRQYTVTTTASCASQQSSGSAYVKQVTLQVSDPGDNNKILVTSPSTFSRCTQAGVGGSDPASSACQN
jgi:Tfp pilus assembly protein PilV